ncbi:hypothetical protein AVEN_119285-1 [Araneus ventricosus]|uniref:Uncharacterized protein n=1 Tax=Araneus ventricosus TaxID=182803 RepID=A0A4Y2EIC2_ARAVE|nr:hypothetical protein AVEN_119285-1 [Araneus ventricosus]
MARQSKWSNGYPEWMDIHPLVSHRSNSGPAFQMDIWKGWISNLSLHTVPILVRQSKWSNGYPQRLDIQSLASRLSTSGPFSTVKTDLDVKLS